MKVVTGPGQYVREANVLEKIGLYVKEFGQSALLIGGETALSVAKPKIIKSLETNELPLLEPIPFSGECSWSEINRLVEIVHKFKPDVLIGIGGGKALDTVKAVAYAVKLPLIAVPTIAATCAAATPISILYYDEGIFIEISRKAKAPNVVLVDMEIIQSAPYRFLVAGIGDTLAKWFESRASVQKVKPNARNQSAVRLANGIFQLLLEEGEAAIEAVKQGTENSSLEDVVDSIILISGSVSGYGGDDCRTAAAHAIYSGLTIFPEVHDTYHGEIVAYGILAQLCLEEKPIKEITDLISFYQKVKLPYQLLQMGIQTLSPEQWKQLGEVSVTIEDMANMPFVVTPSMVIKAIQQVEEIGKLVNVQ
ncbi:glycerol 2-dehydrogenase (NAD+) [Bacillus oleivorans]|uniref:Glycerol 2-dehydrogenase (NAD+) n=1 Tax=Bacillus oleivorans TaxID=1448271 RepID=A0A285CT18_9BACI|nr:iron-containing alcohol dehydrogenase family protein [Bacillus oleivorans]SNX70691.1 glycerol 2-dehydrogenase (NAD+) [Bacillus oleivorans]